jgi:rhodanese-related sulfurtransferase
MKKYILLSIFIVIMIMALFISGLAPMQNPEVPRVDAKMAYNLYRQGQVILIDAMGPKTFAKKHILGSINIPNDGPEDLERVRNMQIPFPREKEILVYCM